MIFTIIFGVLSVFVQYAIWVYAPVEASLGIVQKIFYLHLPFAWWGMFSFFVLFIASILFLKTNKDKFDALARACAEVGVLFTGLALICGSIWAKASWGVWWLWEPRLTTTFIMWFVYAGYLLIQTLNIDSGKKKRISAVIGIVAFLNVPLVFVSARMWRSVHPVVFASKHGGLPPEMFYTIIISLVGFGFLWISLLILRFRQLFIFNKLEQRLMELQGAYYER
ncbi:MAG: cytochrome c biogenesis protein [Desulfonauticus sp.]|nr:cytochrome c biogenesis protein [Desulfonauticus sp.]